MIYMNEEFVPVKEYEGSYIINKNGKVISIKNNKPYIVSTKINYRTGYVELTLRKNGRGKTKLLHRLLAIHFLENPNNYPVVNHKNGIKTDNRLENLEWCNISYNTKHAYEHNISNFRNDILDRLNKINYDTEYVIVILIDKNKNTKVFKSTNEASEFLNTHKDNITRSIRTGNRTNGYYTIGYKRKDLEQFANGEPLPEVLKGIPWEIRLRSEESCNDYPSEGE